MSLNVYKVIAENQRKSARKNSEKEFSQIIADVRRR